jgi:hypothetical protein
MTDPFSYTKWDRFYLRSKYKTPFSSERKNKMSRKIDTVPLPEMPKELVINIPEALIKEFRDDIRVVIRFPWIVGIPVPEFLLEKMGLAGKLDDFDVMIIPEEFRY